MTLTMARLDENINSDDSGRHRNVSGFNQLMGFHWKNNKLIRHNIAVCFSGESINVTTTTNIRNICHGIVEKYGDVKHVIKITCVVE